MGVNIETGIIIGVIISTLLFFISWTLESFSKNYTINNEDESSIDVDKQKMLSESSGYMMILSIIILTVSLIVYIFNETGWGEQLAEESGSDLEFGKGINRALDDDVSSYSGGSLDSMLGSVY